MAWEKEAKKPEDLLRAKCWVLHMLTCSPADSIPKALWDPSGVPNLLVSQLLPVSLEGMEEDQVLLQGSWRVGS